MQQVDGEAEWLVVIGTEENSIDDLAVMDHWLLEDFADILPESPEVERAGA